MTMEIGLISKLGGVLLYTLSLFMMEVMPMNPLVLFVPNREKTRI